MAGHRRRRGGGHRRGGRYVWRRHYSRPPRSNLSLTGPDVVDLPVGRLFSVLARPPLDQEQNSAWFLSRTEGDPPRYDLHEVNPPDWPNPRSDAALWPVRAIAVSPFPEDQRQFLYLGGYDGRFQPDHNAAWLYRVDAALARYGASSCQ